MFTTFLILFAAFVLAVVAYVFQIWKFLLRSQEAAYWRQFHLHKSARESLLNEQRFNRESRAEIARRGYDIEELTKRLNESTYIAHEFRVPLVYTDRDNFLSRLRFIGPFHADDPSTHAGYPFEVIDGDPHKRAVIDRIARDMAKGLLENKLIDIIDVSADHLGLGYRMMILSFKAFRPGTDRERVQMPKVPPYMDMVFDPKQTPMKNVHQFNDTIVDPGRDAFQPAPMSDSRRVEINEGGKRFGKTAKANTGSRSKKGGKKK